MQHSRLFRNVSAEASARVLYLATRFFIPPFVLAHIGMQSYGLYGTVFILVAYFGVSAIGFSNAYVKHVAQYAVSGETSRANRLLSSGFTLSCVLSLIGFSGVVLLWNRVATWMKVPAEMMPDARFLTFIITGSFFAYLSLSVFRDVLTGLQRIALVQRIWILSFMTETALIFALVGCGMGLRGLGIAFFVRNGIDLAGQFWQARKNIPWLRVRFMVPDRQSLRLLAGFGGIVQINCLLAIFLSSVERVIATPLLGLEAAGLLDLGKRFPGMASSIPSAFASSVLPSAADLHAGGGEGRLRDLYFSTARYMNAVSGLLFAFLCFAAAPALVFWLHKVPAGAAVLLVIFAVSTQVHLLTGPGTSVLKAAGKPMMEFHYSIANCLALAVIVPSSRLILGHWDVTGIAAAVALSTLVSAAWFISRANQAMSIGILRFAREVLLPGFLPYVAGGLCIYPFAHWAAAGNRVHAAIALIALASLYFTVAGVLLTRFAANRQERAGIRQLASKVRTRLGRGVPSGLSAEASA